MDTYSISFDNLPQAVAELHNKLNRIEQLLLDKSSTPEPQAEVFLTVKEAAEFLHVKVPTIYSKVNKSELPFMKQGKRLYFSNLELADHLKKNKKKSYAQIGTEAEVYMRQSKFSTNLKNKKS